MTLAAATEFASVTNLAAATNEHLANLSNTLIYSSMAVYTLAFFAYIAEWTFGSRSKIGRTAAALTGATAKKADAPAVAVKNMRRHHRAGAAEGRRTGRVRLA